MRSCWTPIEYHRLRAPAEDRGALIVPPLDRVAAVIEENARLRSRQDCDIQGRRLVELSGEARRALLGDARRWVGSYSEVSPSAAAGTDLIFLAGHQPGLFHPGIWLKNFALGALARQHGATAVGLLIDSDTVRGTALPVPGGSPCEPQVEAIPLDLPEPKIPYELRSIADRGLFAGFGRRVARRIASLVPDPLIETYWPLALARMQQTDNLGACLAQSRHQLEAAWGLQTLEVPQSLVCEAEPFYWFLAHLLARFAELWEVHNEAAGAYRRVHRIRSAAHPVPDLRADGDWLEAPFWAYSADDPLRRPLFARRRGKGIVISDRKRLEVDLPLALQRNAGGAVQRLIELRRQGVRIRSRALITTLWARLALGELFLHGIGGAKYEQVTDVLIERLFGLRPPGIMVLSATLHLPIERQPVTARQVRTIREELRRLAYHPERYIDAANGDQTPDSGSLAELVAEKVRWVQTPQTSQNARLRCRTIRRINRALQPWVQSQRGRLLRLREQADRGLRAEEILSGREYAFCLFPEKTIRGFLQGLLPNGG
jgi:hypothetical protein